MPSAVSITSPQSVYVDLGDPTTYTLNWARNSSAPLDQQFIVGNQTAYEIMYREKGSTIWLTTGKVESTEKSYDLTQIRTITGLDFTEIEYKVRVYYQYDQFTTDMAIVGVHEGYADSEIYTIIFKPESSGELSSYNDSEIYRYPFFDSVDTDNINIQCDGVKHIPLVDYDSPIAGPLKIKVGDSNMALATTADKATFVDEPYPSGTYIGCKYVKEDTSYQVYAYKEDTGYRYENTPAYYEKSTYDYKYKTNPSIRYDVYNTGYDKYKYYYAYKYYYYSTKVTETKYNRTDSYYRGYYYYYYYYSYKYSYYVSYYKGSSASSVGVYGYRNDTYQSLVTGYYRLYYYHWSSSENRNVPDLSGYVTVYSYQGRVYYTNNYLYRHSIVGNVVDPCVHFTAAYYYYKYYYYKYTTSYYYSPYYSYNYKYSSDQVNSRYYGYYYYEYTNYYYYYNKDSSSYKTSTNYDYAYYTYAYKYYYDYAYRYDYYYYYVPAGNNKVSYTYYYDYKNGYKYNTRYYNYSLYA